MRLNDWLANKCIHTNKTLTTGFTNWFTLVCGGSFFIARRSKGKSTHHEEITNSHSLLNLPKNELCFAWFESHCEAWFAWFVNIHIFYEAGGYCEADTLRSESATNIAKQPITEAWHCCEADEADEAGEAGCRFASFFIAKQANNNEAAKLVTKHAHAYAPVVWKISGRPGRPGRPFGNHP